MRFAAAGVTVTVLLAACAAPSRPHVLVLPGDGKTLEQFHADDLACRQWAAQQPGVTTDWRYDMAYMQCMYVKGHKIPVPGGAGTYRALPAPAPSATGTPPSSGTR